MTAPPDPSAIHFVGDDALALRVEARGARHALAAALRAGGTWLDVVPGKGEVTVQFDPLTLPPDEARRRLEAEAARAPPLQAAPAEPLTLSMKTDPAAAPDLARIASKNGLSPEAFLARLCASPLVVDMMGFTAGFAYVAGADPALAASRLDTPRQKVPAGSVGFLTGQLGLYALAGPAGWPIIGQIAQPLFDTLRDNPFTLEAGQPLRLIPEG